MNPVPASCDSEPIFVVGMPRSGTTFFQRVITAHPDLCTTTRATREFPTSVTLSRLMRLLGKPDTPGEGGRIWDRHLRHDHDVMTSDDVTERSRRFYLAVLDTHLRFYRKKRFLARYPANGLRLGFLHAIFPDARFVHLIRDGRAVCQSVLRMREQDGTIDTWWGVRPPNWRELAERPPVESCARQWTEVVEMIRSSGSRLPDGQYMEIRYEDLAANPVGELERFCRHCELTWNPSVGETMASGMASRNYKWQEAFSSDDIAIMNRIMEPLLLSLGYTVS